MASLVEQVLQKKIEDVKPPLAVRLPGGRRIGPERAAVTVTVHDLAALALLASGSIGAVGEAYVEKRLDIDGPMRDVCDVAVALLGDDPTQSDLHKPGVLRWWREVMRRGKSLARHSAQSDARQIEFHYDLNGSGSDDFYGLWLDSKRVYSCAYYREPGLTLEQAQEAKLDHICRKLMLRPGERMLDIGAGWGALLFWAAERYGVQAHGVTLSKHQHAYVSGEIARRGLGARVRIDLLDYRAIDESQPYDKIASIGMFEHVGLANLPTYFAKIRRLLAPGGLLMNHGITAGGTKNEQLGAGIGDFVERYIFPGGELMHASVVLAVMAEAGLEAVDVENLRPHYAKTLWAWSDAFEARLDQARALSSEAVVRAYRLYLAGSAMAFERGWMALHQIVATRPDGDVSRGSMRGAQSVYPFNREHLDRASPQPAP